MENQQLAKSDPRHHTAKIKRMLCDLAIHIRSDEEKVTEPKALALFETTAEVLNGLVVAYDHYEAKSEAAWR